MIINIDEHTTVASVSSVHAPVIYRLFMRDINELKDIFSFAGDDYALEDELAFIQGIGEDSRYNFYILHDNIPCGKLGLYEHNTRVNTINIMYWTASEFRGRV
jgi:hypothetical protein